MSITPQFLDQLKSRLQLSDVIGARVKVQRAGREFKACCPFHKEKTPSFTINDDKQFYHCFGCGAHGDVIGFVMQHDNLSFIEAVEALAAKAGMQVPKSSPEEIKKAKVQKSLYSLMDCVTSWYQEQLSLAKNADIQTYLKERGLKAKTLDHFRIGYAPEDNSALRQRLLDEGYAMEEMIEAGVFRKSNKGGDPYPFMRDRVIFPVADRRGRIVAFGGRTLPDHIAAPTRGDYTPPKYLNSSETPIFHKGRMLYGESHARQAVGEGEPLFVVEGYMDVIACHQAGLKGAVAPLGTALTEEQITSLWQMIPGKPKNPILCFDGDNAGLKAADRACERTLPLVQPDQSILFSFLPKGEDPDSLVRAEGAAAFRKRLENAIPLVQFLWTRAISGRSFDTPEARAGLEDRLEQDITKIGDRSLQHYYRQMLRDKIREQFGFRHKNHGAVKGARGRGYVSPPRKPSLLKGREPKSPLQSSHLIREKIMLAVLINHPEIISDIEDELEVFEMSDERLDALRQALIELLTDDEDHARGDIVEALQNSGFERELELILNENIYIHAGFARTERDSVEALEGWKDIWTLIYGQKAKAELKMAGQRFADELSDEHQDQFFNLIREQEKAASQDS